MPDTATGNRGGGRSGGNRRNKYAAANKQLAESVSAATVVQSWRVLCSVGSIVRAFFRLGMGSGGSVVSL
jgi:hypothetical protein